MTPGRGIVLDANILIRAVLGKRMRALLEAYEDSIAFYTPDVCFDDPREYIPRLSNSRGDDPETGLAGARSDRVARQAGGSSSISGFRATGAGANGRARHPRLAGCRRCPRAERPCRNRGSGFFRQRHWPLDHRSSRIVPSELTLKEVSHQQNIPSTADLTAGCTLREGHASPSGQQFCVTIGSLSQTRVTPRSPVEACPDSASSRKGKLQAISREGQRMARGPEGAVGCPAT